MGVFKNGVGRPSNETIKARRILIVAVICAVLVVVGAITLMIGKTNTKNVKGAAKTVNSSVKTEAVYEIVNGKEVKLDVKNGGRDVVVYKVNSGKFKVVTSVKNDSNQKIYYRELSSNFIDTPFFFPTASLCKPVSARKTVTVTKTINKKLPIVMYGVTTYASMARCYAFDSTGINYAFASVMFISPDRVTSGTE